MVQTPTEREETPIDKLRRVMARHRKRADGRDDGNLLGLGQIKQMVAIKSGDAVRGLLIKLVATGEVEVCDFANGIFWRWYVEHKKVAIQPEVVDGRFILQRELMDDECGRRGVWFDAETYTNRARATTALEYERRKAMAFAAGRVIARAQAVRLVEVPE